MPMVGEKTSMPYRSFRPSIREIGRRAPTVLMMAEDSTAWPGVSRPVDGGGLGFGFKWDLGWMNDTLRYFSKDPVHRKFHHDDLTFRAVYAQSENFILPLSHDEVVHGKGSLLSKMPGDRWQQFANLRLLYGTMFAQPGKKLLFMGSEMAPDTEWDCDTVLPWHLLNRPEHRGIQQLVADLNQLYTNTPALHRGDHQDGGFEWVDGSDSEQSVVTFLRRDPESGETLLVVCNYTPTLDRTTVSACLRQDTGPLRSTPTQRCIPALVWVRPPPWKQSPFPVMGVASPYR